MVSNVWHLRLSVSDGQAVKANAIIKMCTTIAHRSGWRGDLVCRSYWSGHLRLAIIDLTRQAISRCATKLPMS